MKSFVKSVHAFLHLPPHERRVLAQTWLLLLTTDLALRLLPFATILRYVQRPHLSQSNPSAGAPLPVSRLAWLVEVAGRYCPAGSSCLKEALVLSWFLTRRGMPATLRIGVGRHDGAFAAHAWLEQDGQIIFGDRGRDTYAPILQYAMRSHRS